MKISVNSFDDLVKQYFSINDEGFDVEAAQAEVEDGEEFDEETWLREQEEQFILDELNLIGSDSFDDLLKEFKDNPKQLFLSLCGAEKIREHYRGRYMSENAVCACTVSDALSDKHLRILRIIFDKVSQDNMGKNFIVYVG